MKTLLALFLIAGACFADQPLSFPSLTTSKGVTYKDVKVSRFDASELRFIHSGGAATVPLGELPAGVQKLFGYDPVNASFETIVKQEERRKAIIEAADKKAKNAAIVEKQQRDAEELKDIQRSALRCSITQIVSQGKCLIVRVSSVEKQPIKVKGRDGKYERLSLDANGKPELAEQLSNKPFAWGGVIQILPKSASVGTGGFINLYLVEQAAGYSSTCALTAEDALNYRRKIEAMNRADRLTEIKESVKAADAKP
jgi:hypothetical protein